MDCGQISKLWVHTVFASQFLWLTSLWNCGMQNCFGGLLGRVACGVNGVGEGKFRPFRAIAPNFHWLVRPSTPSPPTNTHAISSDRWSFFYQNGMEEWMVWSCFFVMWSYMLVTLCSHRFKGFVFLVIWRKVFIGQIRGNLFRKILPAWINCVVIWIVSLVLCLFYFE